MTVTLKVFWMGERVHIDQLLLDQGMVIFLSPLPIDGVNNQGELIDFFLFEEFWQNGISLGFKLVTRSHWL